jgi:hypothetical protein
MLIEGTFDRPEFDAVDRVTARGLNWVNGRAIELEAYQRLETAQQLQLNESIERVRTIREGAVFSDMQLRLRREAGGANREGADAEAREPDAERSLTALEGLLNSVNQLVYHARNVEYALSDDQTHLAGVLPSWANERFRHVMETYQQSRRETTPRPQAAMRNVLALPVSTVASLIRGSQPVQEQDYFGVIAAQSLRDLSQPVRLREPPSGGVTPIAVNLSDFATQDRPRIQELMRAVEAVQVEVVEGNRLMADLRRINSSIAPDFNTPGSTRQQSEDAGAAQQRAADTETPPTETAPPAPSTPEEPPTTTDTPAEPAGEGGGKSKSRSR